MKLALACVPLMLSMVLAVAVLAAGIPKVGDPIENVYADLVKIPRSDEVILVSQVCPGTPTGPVLHRSFYGPSGATVDSATAAEFDIVGAPHPFVVATYAPDGDLPLKLYVADADGKIVKVVDDPASSPICTLL